MRIAWLCETGQDFVEIRRYIVADHPGVAVQVAKRILDTVAYLCDHPMIGRVGRLPGTRELVIPGFPYIVPYRVKSAAIEIKDVRVSVWVNLYLLEHTGKDFQSEIFLVS
jgi:toxin ParE1/3/4